MDDLERKFYQKQAQKRPTILNSLDKHSEMSSYEFMQRLFDQTDSFYNDAMELREARKQRANQKRNVQETLNIDVSQAKKEIDKAVKELDSYIGKLF